MENTYTYINSFHNCVAMLKENAGADWKEVRGEAHRQYNEGVIWVLLYGDADVIEAHDSLMRLVSEFEELIKPLCLDITYKKFSGKQVFTIARYAKNEFIIRYPKINLAKVRKSYEKVSIFESNDSDRSQFK